MASTGQALLCILLVLVFFSGCAHGFWHQLRIVNEDNAMAFQNYVTFENYTRIIDPPGVTNLPQGQSWQYFVLPETMEILSSFQMTNSSGCYAQEIFSWRHRQVPPPSVACAPQCSWQVNENGFYVSDVGHGQPLQFVSPWLGPSNCPSTFKSAV